MLYLFRPVLLLSLLVFFSGPAYADLTQAEDLYEQGRYKEAIESLFKGAQGPSIFPPETALFLVKAAHAQKDWRLGIRMLDQIADSDQEQRKQPYFKEMITIFEKMGDQEAQVLADSAQSILAEAAKQQDPELKRDRLKAAYRLLAERLRVRKDPSAKLWTAAGAYALMAQDADVGERVYLMFKGDTLARLNNGLTPDAARIKAQLSKYEKQSIPRPGSTGFKISDGSVSKYSDNAKDYYSDFFPHFYRVFPITNPLWVFEGLAGVASINYQYSLPDLELASTYLGSYVVFGSGNPWYEVQEDRDYEWLKIKLGKVLRNYVVGKYGTKPSRLSTGRIFMALTNALEKVPQFKKKKYKSPKDAADFYVLHEAIEGFAGFVINYSNDHPLYFDNVAYQELDYLIDFESNTSNINKLFYKLDLINSEFLDKRVPHYTHGHIQQIVDKIENRIHQIDRTDSKQSLNLFGRLATLYEQGHPNFPPNRFKAYQLCDFLESVRGEPSPFLDAMRSRIERVSPVFAEHERYLEPIPDKSGVISNVP